MDPVGVALLLCLGGVGVISMLVLWGQTGGERPLSIGSDAAALNSMFRRNHLLAAAKTLGLTELSWDEGWAEGQAPPLRIRLHSGGGAAFIRTHIRIEGLPRELGLHAETLGAAMKRGLGGREVALGDDAFDRAVDLAGPQGLVHALFDAETRERTRHTLRGESPDGTRWPTAMTVPAEISVQDGRLEAVIAHQSSMQVEEAVVVAVRDLLDFARRLLPPPDPAARIGLIARDDPQEGVRVRCALCLGREYADAPAARPALRAALADASPWVRLAAAQGLGDEGHAALMALAEQDSVPDEVAARAIDSLAGQGPPDRRCVVLERALRSGRWLTARACLGLPERWASPALTQSLALAMRLAQGDLAASVATALGATGDRAAEPALLDALRREPAVIPRAAAAALGLVGSTAAVPALRDAEHGPDADTDLRRAAREAITAIQMRLEGATPGQLSLVATDEGRLSLADDAEGKLSLTDEGDGS